MGTYNVFGVVRRRRCQLRGLSLYSSQTAVVFAVTPVRPLFAL